MGTSRECGNDKLISSRGLLRISEAVIGDIGETGTVDACLAAFVITTDELFVVEEVDETAVVTVTVGVSTSNDSATKHLSEAIFDLFRRKRPHFENPDVAC